MADDANNMLRQAEDLFVQGAFSAAKELCDKILGLEPEHTEALHLKAIMAYQKNQLEKALSFAAKASQLKPDNPHYLNTLGLIQRNMRQPDQALITFQIALTHKPDFGKALANMALVYLDKGELQQALACFEKALPLLPANPEFLTNYAHTLRDTGQTEKAAEVYRNVLALAPESERFLLNVGAIELALSNEDAALHVYEKVLLQNPEEPTARHIVAGLRGENTATAPLQYVEDLFDVYAQDFDHHLASLAYEVPQMLGARIPAVVAPKAKPGTWNVLDLGCGTGACGLQFAEHKAHMVGVDLSQNMLDKAEEHGVYDTLFKGSIQGYFNQTPLTFDLVLAADVYVYIGDLSSSFQAIAKTMNKGGLYGFSTELAQEEQGDKQGYVLRSSGRFAHKDSYIKSLARGFGFHVMTEKDIVVRKDAKGQIAGKLYIFKKTTS